MPWKEYCKEGNSLFWWRFVYGWFVFIIFVLYITYSFGILKNIHYNIIPSVAKAGFITGMILTLLALIITTGYISLFLNDFVVPLMYKNRISATKAWSKFISLAVHNMGSLFVYGLFVFALTIAVVSGVIIRRNDLLHRPFTNNNTLCGLGGTIAG
jgi:hypothetical protein